MGGYKVEMITEQECRSLHLHFASEQDPESKFYIIPEAGPGSGVIR